MVRGSYQALSWISVAVFFALSLWFSTSVIVDEIRLVWNVGAHVEAWLSAAIPIGFVLGSFVSAYLGIADRFHPRKIFALSATLGALLNFFVMFVDSAMVGILFRILTGITLAGVYPIAVKILSQWFPKNRGVAIGILIAALTMGTALPHFVVMFFAQVDWKIVISCSSLLALFAAFIVLYLVKDGPVKTENIPFSFQRMKKILTNKPVMLANYGYFGHMWELYAMWTWLPVFFAASFTNYAPDTSQGVIAFSSFVSIGLAGAIGCIAGGLLSDKIGRANVTMYAMIISAICCLTIGFTFGKTIWITLIIAFFWGISIIADSAQFSVAVSEILEVDYVGTALTFQLGVGFLLTIFSINLIPIIQRIVGWEWVFAILSIGPILGIMAMFKYRRYESN